jgi:hypothetical protein
MRSEAVKQLSVRLPVVIVPLESHHFRSYSLYQLAYDVAWQFVEDATPPVVKEKFGDAAGTYLH